MTLWDPSLLLLVVLGYAACRARHTLEWSVVFNVLAALVVLAILYAAFVVIQRGALAAYLDSLKALALGWAIGFFWEILFRGPRRRPA